MSIFRSEVGTGNLVAFDVVRSQDIYKNFAYLSVTASRQIEVRSKYAGGEIFFSLSRYDQASIMVSAMLILIVQT